MKIIARILGSIFAVIVIYMFGFTLLNNISADESEKYELHKMEIETVQRCVMIPYGFVPNNPLAKVIILKCGKNVDRPDVKLPEKKREDVEI